MKTAPLSRAQGHKRGPKPDAPPRHPVTDEPIDTSPALHDEFMGEEGAYAALPLNLRRAVDTLVLGGTGMQAATAAGYNGNDNTLAVRGHMIRRRPDVIAAVIEREAVAMEEAGLTLYRTWLETRRIAYFDPAELFDAKGQLKPMHELSPDARAAIQSIEIDTVREEGKKGKMIATTTVKVKLWNKLDALKVHLTGKGVLKQSGLEGALINVTNNTQINNTQEAADRVAGAANATDAAIEYQQLMGNVIEHKP